MHAQMFATVVCPLIDVGNRHCSRQRAIKTISAFSCILEMLLLSSQLNCQYENQLVYKPSRKTATCFRADDFDPTRFNVLVR